MIIILISIFTFSFMCINGIRHYILLDLSCLKQEYTPHMIEIQTFINQH